jgi:YggT family protein
VQIVRWIIQAYVLIIFARVILSWFPLSPGSALIPVVRVLNALTEPVLAPIRRVLPAPQVGSMGIDLSPLIVLLVLQILILPLFR